MENLKKYNPQFQHINDTVAFVVHLCFLQENCKLIGLSEEQYLDDLGSIPQGWNKSNEIYQFRYIEKENNNNNNNKNKKNAPTILVKVLQMDDNELLVTAVKQSKNEVITLDININDFIDLQKAKKSLSDYSQIYKNINSLQLLLNEQITNKLTRNKANDKEEKNNEDNKNKKKKKNDDYYDEQHFYPPHQQPNPNPLLIGGGIGGGMGGGVPFGGGDLDPFGFGGGNLMGPNQINQQFKNKNKMKPKGPYVPPGARFDPYGPGGQFPSGPDPDHFRPPRGGRGGGFGGGGGGGFGGFGGIV